jgi:hypothetical protein
MNASQIQVRLPVQMGDLDVGSERNPMHRNQATVSNVFSVHQDHAHLPKVFALVGDFLEGSGMTAFARMNEWHLRFVGALTCAALLCSCKSHGRHTRNKSRMAKSLQCEG